MRRNLIALAIFVVVCLGLLAALAGQLGIFGGNGELYTVRLKDAGGLVIGNAVRIAGVEVGRVESIRLQDNRAVLDISVDREVQLYAGDCAKPRPKSLLGEKYLHLDQGTEASGSPIAPGSEIACTHEMVDVGDALEGLAPILQSEEDIYPIVVKIIKRIDKLTSGFDTPPSEARDGDIDSDGDDSKPRDDDMIANLGGLVTEAHDVAITTHDILSDNRSDLREMVVAGKRLLTDPRLSRSIGHLEAASRDTKELVAHLERVTTKAEATIDRLDRALSDERLADIDASIRDGRVALKSLREFSESLTGISKTTSTLVDALSKIAKRTANISERDIRKFLQKEGVRVRVLLDRDVRRRINELDKNETEG